MVQYRVSTHPSGEYTHGCVCTHTHTVFICLPAVCFFRIIDSQVCRMYRTPDKLNMKSLFLSCIQKRTVKFELCR